MSCCRRGSEVEDAFSQLGAGSRVPGSQLKGPMMVSFVNQQGLAEAGVDQGGLLKEFLTEASTGSFYWWSALEFPIDSQFIETTEPTSATSEAEALKLFRWWCRWYL